jgi:hypothetical protein
MREDEPDAMGLGVPPPVIFLGPLILGLLLNRKIPAPFLPRGLTRIVGLPLRFLSEQQRAGPIAQRMLCEAQPPTNSPRAAEGSVSGWGRPERYQRAR